MQTSTKAVPIYNPRNRVDLLHTPLVGRFLRWRWSRLVGQTLLLAIAALMVYDGFTGPQLAPSNTATVLAWVHYRGIVMLGFLAAVTDIVESESLKKAVLSSVPRGTEELGYQPSGGGGICDGAAIAPCPLLGRWRLSQRQVLYVLRYR